MPPRIDATPEDIAREVLTTRPPKEWRYLKAGAGIKSNPTRSLRRGIFLRNLNSQLPRMLIFSVNTCAATPLDGHIEANYPPELHLTVD